MKKKFKTKLGIVKVRKCSGCGDRCSCTWDICPFAAEIGNITDPNEAIWLCDKCIGERAMDI